jgi:heme-degrading monooxygenase HmoA
MYAQATAIRVPMGTMAQMRQVIEEEYLPRVRNRPGFVSAQFLEQIDDPDSALLIVCWDNQAAVENFNRTNLLEASVQALAVRLPGVRVQREGYLISINISGQEQEETQPSAAHTN